MDKNRKWKYAGGVAVMVLLFIGGIMALIHFAGLKDAEKPNKVETTQLAKASVKGKTNMKGITNQDYASLLKYRSYADEYAKYKIGYLKIPSRNIKLPIYRGVNNVTLSLGVATYYNSEQMGSGNFVLAGHNMDRQNVLLSNMVPSTSMGVIKKGATIQLLDKHHTYNYKVDSRHYTSANQPVYKDNNKPTPDSILYQEVRSPRVTLFTCNTNGTKRYVVTGTFSNVE